MSTTITTVKYMAMTNNIYKVDPITFKRSEVNARNTVNNNLKKISTTIESMLNDNESFETLVNELSQIIETDANFYGVPADTRFPFNLSDLSTHLRFAGGLMYFFTRIAVDRIGLDDTLRLLGFPPSIDKKTLYASVRFAGIMHDITKPEVSNHSTNSADRVGEWLNNISITTSDEANTTIKEIIVEAIRGHHETSKGNNLGELIKICDWISTSDRIKIVWPEFQVAMLEKYPDQSTGYGKDKEEKKDIANVFREYVEKINRIKDPMQKGKEDDDLYDKLKNVKTYHWKSSSYFPYFLSPDSTNSITTKLKELKKLFGDNIDFQDRIISMVKVEFKQKQAFIFESPLLKHIKGASLLIQIAERIFKQAFSKLYCPELILSSGGGELLGLVPATFKKEDLEKEIRQEFKDMLSDLFRKKPVPQKQTEALLNELMKKVGIVFKSIAFRIDELLFGIDLENDITKSYEDSYYYNILQDPNKEIEEKEKILKYFFEPTYLHQKFNESQNFEQNFAAFINEVTKSEFFIQFQNKKGFGELVSAFELYWQPSTEKFDPQQTVVTIDDLCIYCQKRRGTDRTCVICELKEQISGDYIDRPDNYEDLIIIQTLKEVKEKLNLEISLKDLQVNTLDELSFNPLMKNNENTIAFLKFDGNNFGVMKQQLKTVGMYQAFSRFVNQTTSNAMSSAIIKSLREWSEMQQRETVGFILDKIPASIFILGGDDISFVLHSELAFPFLKYFSTEINKSLGTLSTPADLAKRIGDTNSTFYPSGYSGSVVFHQSTTPLQIVNETADNLESKSKKFAKFFLNPYSDWDPVRKDKLVSLRTKPYYPKTLDKLTRPGDRIISGAYNTVSIYYSISDLSKDAVSKYFDGKSYKYYSTALFPMDIETFVKEFQGKMKQISKIAGDLRNRTNIVKSILRTGITIIPEEFRLNLYYKAGKETEDKSKFWETMANSLIIKKIFDEESEMEKSLIDWFEPSELSRFYWEG